MRFLTACVFHAIVTYVYYKFTEHIGFYINWGYLTDYQITMYMLASIGWIIILVVWVFLIPRVGIDD